MKKIFLLVLLLVVPQLYAEDIQTSSEVVDPLAPQIVPEAAPDVSIEDIDDSTDITEADLQTDEVAPVPEAEPVPEAITETITEEPAQVETAVVEAVSPAPVESPLVPIATPPLRSKFYIEPDDQYFARQSHWLTNFGFESMNYIYPAEFVGNAKSFDEQTRPLYGPRLGFGREFYMGRGFNTTTRAEAFYMGTLFESPKQVDNAIVVEEAYVKRTGQIWGGELSQSLGFLFNLATKNPFMDEMSHLTLEPYVFAGIGRARAYNRLSYRNDTASEDYRVRVQDSIASTSLGFGLNMTSITGFFLYLKATQYTMNFTKRNEEGSSDISGVVTRFNRTSTDVDPEVISIYALGGGYKF